jgi:hypothetical protein
VRRLVTLGQPHRNTAIQAPLQSRRSLALLVALVLCLSAFLLAANEAWAKEQPSRAAQQGPAKDKNTPNGNANGKVAEPVRGTPTPPVTPPPVQGPPAVTPPVQTPPVENAPPPPTSETPFPAEKPSSPPLDPAPATPKPDPAPQPTPQPAPQTGAGGEDVESDPVPNTSQPPMTDSGRVVEPEPVSAASPDLVDEVKDIVHYLAPAPTPAPATPAAADDGHAAGPAPDPVLPLPALAAASDQVLPAASEGLAALVRGLVTEPATAPAAASTAPMAQWRDGGPLTTFTNNKRVAAVAAAAVPAAPAVGEAMRLSSSLGTRTAGVLGSAVGTVPSAAANAAASAAARVATSVASATAEVFRTLVGGSAGTPSTDATNGTQQAPSGGTPQVPVAPLAPPLGGVFSPFTGAAGQLGPGGGVAPLLVGILALLTVIMARRDFRTYLIACEMPKPSSALLRPLERPG